MTREQFSVIKCHHHLRRLSTIPPSFQRKALELAHFAKPAFRSDYFDETARRLAEEWLEETHQALLVHYNDTLEAALATLRRSPMPEPIFERSLLICTRWARGQLGRKLDPSVLDAALSAIRDAQRTFEFLQAPTDKT
ncbi:MAG: hypothetical protein AAGK05_19170, partial [Pseudomonadota bacterium]